MQGAKQLYLYLVAEVAYFVQKDGTAVGCGECAGLVGQRTGKGTFYVTEEFGSGQLFGDGSAVNGYERLPGAAAQLMDALRHILLTRSAGSVDEDGHIGGRNQIYIVIKLFGGIAFALQVVGRCVHRAVGGKCFIRPR